MVEAGVPSLERVSVFSCLFDLKAPILPQKCASLILKDERPIHPSKSSSHPPPKSSTPPQKNRNIGANCNITTENPFSLVFFDKTNILTIIFFRFLTSFWLFCGIFCWEDQPFRFFIFWLGLATKFRLLRWDFEAPVRMAAAWTPNLPSSKFAPEEEFGGSP